MKNSCLGIELTKQVQLFKNSFNKQVFITKTRKMLTAGKR